MSRSKIEYEKDEIFNNYDDSTDINNYYFEENNGLISKTPELSIEEKTEKFFEFLEFEDNMFNSFNSFCQEIREYVDFYCLEDKVINIKRINIFEILDYMNEISDDK